MNDFTKKELIEIQEAVNYWHEGIETRLTDKLQSMIDNYCEHECNHENLDTNICYKCGWGIGR